MSAEATVARDRKLVGLSLLLFTVAGGFFCYVLYLQRPPAPSTQHNSTRMVGGHEVYVPEISAAERNANIAKAKHLRELFRPWALTHKPELERMLNAQGDDEQALASAYNMLPHQPQYKGTNITRADLAAGQDQFTWDVGIEKMRLSPQMLNDPLQRQNHEKTINFQKDRSHKDYVTYHDIAVSQAMSIGVKFIKLWASGRITETTLKIENTRYGNKMFDDANEMEIVPPYEFLSRNERR